jgi:hypothetical protein
MTRLDSRAHRRFDSGVCPTYLLKISTGLRTQM